MTSRIGTEVQDESQEFVNQRSRLWEKYDEALQQERELNQYAGQFSSSNSSQNLPNLSNTNTPPDELAAAVWQLKQESEKIKQARSRIQSYQEDIAKTKQQFFIVVGIAVVVFIIILIMIFNR
jgi:outer membrane protein TolC